MRGKDSNPLKKRGFVVNETRGDQTIIAMKQEGKKSVD